MALPDPLLKNLPDCCSDALEKHLNADLFKALCDPQRLTLLAQLATSTEPVTVSEASNCCNVHLSGVSRHLNVLRQAGVVDAEKHGREVRYRLNGQLLVRTLRGLADAIEECCTAVGCCGFPTKSDSNSKTDSK
jgi:ArsR family transcriptional regulator, arsenate/arsenite/antimonite-responsive transcriptional repressor